MARLRAPNGAWIVATLELVPATCDISDVMPITRKEDGTFEFEWGGYTEVNWNGQKTVVREGQRVFIDDDGGKWLESELILVEDEDA